MKKIILLSLGIALFSCKNKQESHVEPVNELHEEDTSIVEEIKAELVPMENLELTLSQANKLVDLPLACISVKYPYKSGQTLTSKKDLKEPQEFHPAFYGCFDWHSSVHAHWSLVSLLKRFPDLKKAEEIKKQLTAHLSKENIQQELKYFKKKENKSFERTYGWAWLLKLSEELHTWDDSLAKPLEQNLQPLTNQIVVNYIEFLPKLNYPIRVGEHENTAFGMSFAYDYAKTTNHEKLQNLITSRAKDFYLGDDNCPMGWEPSGFDFLSPCLAEVDLMQRVLAEQTFKLWLKDFMPQLLNKNFELTPGEVSDRTDGKLVHLDGLNYSRAWVFYHLANKYPDDFKHLKNIGNQHVSHSIKNLFEDSYEGGHWLGTFSIYALSQRR
ncbi:DUF2891 domain-containing protein [Mesonia aestuariivivens]|uniref:DUF2891 domain-containing protein n=1 Tax=Mesonia aestuariivivens TaxID=2796128 RepID=A0ABS6W3Q9_9FLAO|nr:DUF2891 domain-containing protein [Mesonia aestuariivivens]MBW2962500.1 DUF2891 domain-containing protein [Mesonia aestuariivivens]